MKIKNIVVEVKSVENTLKEAKEVMEKLKEGKVVKRKETISFKNINVMRKVLTNKRIQLIKEIKDHKPASIYELAKLVKRDAKSVNTDLKVLSRLGMVDLKKTKKDRINIIPSVNYEKIDVAIAI